MNINLTPIIQAVIALLATLITCKLIPWIQSRTTEKQQDNLRALIRVLVYAAEQLYGTGKGAVKREYVCEELRKRGFEVDLSEIEAAVYSAFNSIDFLNENTTDHPPDVTEKESGEE